MKRYFNNIKTSILLNACFLLGTMLTSFMAWAGDPVAWVNGVEGRAFVYNNGKTQVLKVGDVLEDFSEVLTEVGSQITVTDYYDHRFHLSGSGHIRLLKRLVDLKRGYLWVQGFTKNSPAKIQTANARVDYESGEAVISYDTTDSKTQILSIDGNWKMSNLLNEYMTVDVGEGKFSFIHKDYENGMPRSPTAIGFDSFKQVTGLFKGVESLGDQTRLFPAEFSKKTQANVRAPASTEAPPPVIEAKSQEVGKFLYVKQAPPIEGGKIDVDSFYAEKIKSMKAHLPKKKWVPNYKDRSGVPVKVFGQAHKAHSEARAPASIPTPKLSTPKPPIPMELNPQVVIPNENAFESGLMKEYKRQMRHEKEVNRLIEDLQSYDQDYKSSF